MNQKILIVDDEENVLSGIKRQLRKDFDIDTTTSPHQALKIIQDGHEYAVIVSDMRMPEMDGVVFLNHVQKHAPDAIRMMLTGNSDQQTAIDAINQGQIFRFLSKPCSAETMTSSLNAALRQHELITAEKVLLEQTLKGSIEVLVDILALTNPIAFSRAERTRYFVLQCAQQLKLENAWMFEIAAMLSQIGFVTVPPDVVEKSIAGEVLNEDEEIMMQDQVKSACQMIEKVPRLELVSQMIAHQNSDPSEPIDNETVKQGALLLRTAIDFDEYLEQGKKNYEAIRLMQQTPEKYQQNILELLAHTKPPTLEQTVGVVDVQDLRIGMVLAEDILSTSHAMIVKKGQEVNKIMRMRLENFLQQQAIASKVRVYQRKPIFE